MAALTAARDTKHRGPVTLAEYPMADDAIIFSGGLVMLDAGYAKPAATATGKQIVGCAIESKDNTNGGNGGKYIKVHEGEFLWDNGETLAQADVGKVVYAADDAGTMFDTSTGKSIAGVLKEVVSEGVWVESSLALSLALVDT